MKSHRHLRHFAVAVLLGGAASASQAHTGHGTSGLFEGLAHPFGLDHLLAMVAVGIWSVSALPAHKAWWGPATFMTSLVVGAVLGAMGVTVPFLEPLISLSVVLLGTMLVLTRRETSFTTGLGLLALAAAMHGLAHGAESPEAGFASYAAGFLITTAALHVSGVGMGLAIRRFMPRVAPLLTSTVGVMFGGAGIYLLGQL